MYLFTCIVSIPTQKKKQEKKTYVDNNWLGRADNKNLDYLEKELRNEHLAIGDPECLPLSGTLKRRKQSPLEYDTMH